MPKVDFSNYNKREQAYVKHCLLEEYLPDWAYKVGSKWDSLVYVDGFAGPWQTKHPDYADSSFGIAVEALRRCQKGLQERGRDLHMESILVDQDKAAFAHLEAFAASKRESLVLVSIRCVDNLSIRFPQLINSSKNTLKTRLGLSFSILTAGLTSRCSDCNLFSKSEVAKC